MAKRKPTLESVTADFNALTEQDKRTFLQPFIEALKSAAAKVAVDTFRETYLEVVRDALAGNIYEISKLIPRNPGRTELKAKCRELRKQKNAKGKPLSYGSIGQHPEILAMNNGAKLSYDAVAKHCKGME